MALGRQDSSQSLFQKVSEALDDYISLQLVFLGVLFIVAGFFVQFLEISWTVPGVWAVVLFLWGVVLVLLGLVLYGLIWWSHQGTLG